MVMAGRGGWRQNIGETVRKFDNKISSNSLYTGTVITLGPSINHVDIYIEKGFRYSTIHKNHIFFCMEIDHMGLREVTKLMISLKNT